MLRKRAGKEKEEQKKKDGEIDDKFWEVLMSADKKEYERICAEYGVKNFRWMLKKLNEMKKEREEEQKMYVETISNLKHIEVKGNGMASFELDLELKDPSSRIFLYKDGVMIPYGSDGCDDPDVKHNLNRIGKKLVFSVKDLKPEDAGLYQVDVEEVNMFSTDFKIPSVDFIVKIQEVKAKEREDALFECVLSHPLSRLMWMGKNVPLEDGEKYTITVSEDRLIHRLLVKDCLQLDKGIYAAMAGIKTCSAWLIVEDPGVQFVSGLSDVNALRGQSAELMCKLSNDQCDGVWFKDGKKLTEGDGITLSKDGACHKLLIDSCEEDHSGRYRFEAEGRKSEATISIKDPPTFNPDDLGKFAEPVIIRVGQTASFKLPFEGRDPMRIQWYREGEELLEDTNIKIEKSTSHSSLKLSKCQRKESGEIKIRLRNDFGTLEAFSRLIVLDKPGPPQGPVEIVESSALCVEIKWRPPKDDGGSPVKNYMMERQQIGRNTWTKIGEIPGVPTYKDTNVENGRKYCYRIRALTEEGNSEMMETDDIMAGTLAFPGQPAAPKVASAFNDCINLTWTAPGDTGGSRITGYNLEKRKKGSNIWSLVNPDGEPIQAKKYAVQDVVAGMEYEFRVTAINVSGPSEPSPPSEFVIARDPKKPPGKVTELRVTDTSYNTVSLMWTKPNEEPGVQDEAKGYFLEVRPAESLEWNRSTTTPIILTSNTVKGLKAMAMYWVRVIATNEGGDGVPTDLDNYILAMPPPVRPKFTTRNMQSFMVVRAGNTVRISLTFEASPWPEIEWLKDGVPVTKRVTISNSDGGSQLLIPSSERSDSGIYTISIKNMVGQESFSIELRVTDEPKPPGPIELEENVPGTVTVVWESSPDEKRDDRLHYMVSQHDSTKRSWNIVAERLFNNKFTACNIMQGREYHFRVYAKNDMGLSAPSESPTWGSTKQRDKFVVDMPEYKTCNFQCAPAFLVPLKVRVAPKGYECYMSCAVKGNPRPRITWYHNNVSLNTDTNYLITNICGVCSILILRVAGRDMGEYTITVENQLGRAESSTRLAVRE
ncbi:immunoglobulin-like and fibronectin type III domain-containing protein 1 [Clupea harengus]|uniref:immunoglobulin-like and fibronectin type III domain-containing protein 1 n=1 Tax=Clupea harengus TaxID=7950 RepID=UPI001C5A506C|nr:immunoglobulin-like and fibronectin type III domain-containing protein 1 [Clupea harengus]